MMRSKIKKYLLIVAVSVLALAGCDSVKEPITEETTVETVEDSTVVVEESTENEAENSVEKGIEEESKEEKLINAEKVAALPIETVKIFEQIAAAYQDGDYIGACKYANQLNFYEETGNQLYAVGFNVMEEPALIGTSNGTIGIYNDEHVIKLYCGDYKEKIREGKGIYIDCWIDNISYSVGEWKDDMPNGKQNIYKEQRWVEGTVIEIENTECLENVVNGLWNGEVNYNVSYYVGEEIDYCEIYTINFDNGKVKVLEQSGSNNVIAYGSTYSSHRSKKEDNAKFIMINNEDLADKLYGCLGTNRGISFIPDIVVD